MQPRPNPGQCKELVERTTGSVVKGRGTDSHMKGWAWCSRKATSDDGYCAQHQAANDRMAAELQRRRAWREAR